MSTFLADLDRHPCFNPKAHSRFGRIHLPVAPRCNISCRFCDRRCACVNESRPGVSAHVVTPEQACELALRAYQQRPELTVAGIAGPGDPLANPHETFATFALLRRELPQLLLCLSSNGLALPDFADEIAALGVHHMTVTVNAVTPSVGAKLYRFVGLGAWQKQGEEGACYLLQQQEAGIRLLKKYGLIVKVNTVVVPGINDHCLKDIAQHVAHWGADLMNCLPLIPVAGTALGHCPPPSPALMQKVRSEASAFMPQMHHCSRCRADALGFLGEQTILSDFAASPTTQLAQPHKQPPFSQPLSPRCLS